MEKYEEKRFLAYIAEDSEKAAINEETRTIRFVISSNELDRDNEIVEPSAIAASMKSFAKNPVCLACHQHKLDSGFSPVVGSWDTASFKQTNKRCEMDLTFADTDLAEDYWKLYKSKHMRAVSIGFRVLEYTEERKEDKLIWTITKIELYEISCVPVGANRDALSKLKIFNDRQLDDSDAFKNLQITLRKDIDKKISLLEETLTAQLDEIKDMLINDPNGAAKSMLGNDSDLAAGDVKELTAEQILGALKNVLTNKDPSN